MNTDDMFGLEREAKIVKSGVRRIFTPHTPIVSRQLFFGRQKEVQKIIEQINTPGQHALLYGERGVGKSSLANIATEVLISSLIQGELYTKRCDSTDTFLSIMAPVLTDFGIEVYVESTTVTRTTGGKGSLRVPIVEVGMSGEKSASTTYRSRDFTPAVVADILRDRRGLLYLDEADRIADTRDKGILAELIKLLSDNGSQFKILVVGVAETAGELTAGHSSVSRCLKETYLRRMTDDELRLVVTEGAKKSRLIFNVEVTNLIVRLSSGYPHFTHLLALKCAEEAVANELKEVDRACLSRAIKLAVEDAESTLRRQYTNATRSYGTTMYGDILLAASRLGLDEFTAGRLRECVKDITGEDISQGALNNFLKRLVADDYTSILHRCAKGVYKFSDPRMPSFIRIVNAERMTDD